MLFDCPNHARVCVHLCMCGVWCVIRQAFTEHYPVVHFAKWVLGMPVVTDMAIEAEHAYLPK